MLKLWWAHSTGVDCILTLVLPCETFDESSEDQAYPTLLRYHRALCLRRQDDQIRQISQASNIKQNFPKTPRHGGNGEEKTESKNTWTFFSHHFSPISGTLFFFRTLKLASPLSLMYWNFSGSGFWIFTKGVKWQPVRSPPWPNSI